MELLVIPAAFFGLVVLALLPSAWRGFGLVFNLLVILWLDRHATAYLGFDPMRTFGHWVITTLMN
jgi:hypothetical protein